MRRAVLGGVVVLAAACSSTDEPTDPLVPRDPVPTTTGSFAARYLVPTTDPALAGAAVFPVDHVDWTVIGDQLTLHYDLPIGLVGGHVDVTFGGSVPAGATRVAIDGAQGTGSCVAAAAVVTCFEVFAELGPLPIDMAVVEQMAGLEYAGPAVDRVAVAELFASDPIGIVEIDTAVPVIDDESGGSDDSP